MTSKHRVALVLVTGVVVVAAIFLVVARSRTPRSSPVALEQVRIGYLPHHAYLPFFAAVEFGTCTPAGIAIDMRRFESSPTMAAAFSSGDLDATGIATASALVTESRDPGRFAIFAVTSETPERPLTGIVVNATSRAKRLEDLHGAKIGVFPGPAATALFGLVLKKHGLERDKDYTFVELAPPLQASALISGQVQALATYEPTVTQMVVEHGAAFILAGAVEREVMAPTQGGVWIVSTNLIKNRPAVADRLVSCIEQAMDAVDKRPEDARRAMSKYLSVSPLVLRRVPLLNYTLGDEIDVIALQKYADLMVEAGVLGKRLEVASLLTRQLTR